MTTAVIGILRDRTLETGSVAKRGASQAHLDHRRRSFCNLVVILVFHYYVYCLNTDTANSETSYRKERYEAMVAETMANSVSC